MLAGARRSRGGPPARAVRRLEPGRRARAMCSAFTNTPPGRAPLRHAAYSSRGSSCSRWWIASDETTASKGPAGVRRACLPCDERQPAPGRRSAACASISAEPSSSTTRADGCAAEHRLAHEACARAEVEYALDGAAPERDQLDRRAVEGVPKQGTIARLLASYWGAWAAKASIASDTRGTLAHPCPGPCRRARSTSLRHLVVLALVFAVPEHPEDRRGRSKKRRDVHADPAHEGPGVADVAPAVLVDHADPGGSHPDRLPAPPDEQRVI